MTLKISVLCYMYFILLYFSHFLLFTSPCSTNFLLSSLCFLLAALLTSFLVLVLQVLCPHSGSLLSYWSITLLCLLVSSVLTPSLGCLITLAMEAEISSENLSTLRRENLKSRK